MHHKVKKKVGPRGKLSLMRSAASGGGMGKKPGLKEQANKILENRNLTQEQQSATLLEILEFRKNTIKFNPKGINAEKGLEAFKERLARILGSEKEVNEVLNALKGF